MFVLFSVLLLFSRSVVSNSLRPHGLKACQAFLSFTISRSLLKLTSTESVMPCNHLILCRPLLLLSSILPSIRVFSNESVLRIRWPKYWSFSFSISPSNECSGLIPFRMDCFALLAIQRTLKSLLQHHSSKAPILQCLALFMVQLSNLYLTKLYEIKYGFGLWAEFYFLQNSYAEILTPNTLLRMPFYLEIRSLKR